MKESLKKAQQRYVKTLKRVDLRFTANELALYNELKSRAEKEGVCLQTYIKRQLEQI